MKTKTNVKAGGKKGDLPVPPIVIVMKDVLISSY